MRSATSVEGEIEEFARRCRELASLAGRAEALPMAEWLRVLADGRTGKDVYAEAAALAWEIDRVVAGSAGGEEGADPGGERNRGRRPVRVLIREIEECLTRAASRSLAAGADGELLPRERVARLGSLLAAVA